MHGQKKRRVLHNLQPVLHHAGVVSSQNWSTGGRLCGGDANALAEELEPLWLTALLLRVPEAFELFGCFISLHSARSSMWLTALGRTDLRMRGGEEDDLDVSRDNMNI